MTTTRKPQPALPDTSQDYCSVCHSKAAPFLFRDRVAGTATRYCGLHVPEDWGMSRSLSRMIEEELLRNGFDK